MIPKKIEEAFNRQIKHELESAYLYLSMVAYFDEAGFPGMARWMRAQVQEELTHAMRFFKHILERGGEVKLQPLSVLGENGIHRRRLLKRLTSTRSLSPAQFTNW